MSKKEPIKWNSYLIERQSDRAEVVLHYGKKEVARYELEYLVEKGLDDLENEDHPEIEFDDKSN